MTPHPSPEVLAAYIDGPQGSLSLRERNDVTAHLADCRECREWWIGSLRTVAERAGEKGKAG